MPTQISSTKNPVPLPEGVCLTLNKHGREFLQVVHPAVNARISVEGAHITHCQLAGQGPLLWMSPDEPELPGKSLRGGIPICWPWFSNTRPGPAHGIARTSQWQLKAVTSTPTQVSVFMALPSSVLAQALPGEQWELEVEFIMSADLQVSLITRNTGSESQTLSQALHSYLPVSDIDKAVVKGLENCTYFDQLTDQQEQQDGPVYFREETDRIYFNYSGEVRLSDAGDDVLLVSREGSESLVVWNPWVEKSLRLGHFPSDGYRHMVCLEAANAGADARLLEPGETHRLSTRLTRVRHSGA